MSERVRLRRSRPRVPVPASRARSRGAVGAGQQVARVLEQRRARRRERDAAAVALEQAHAELCLERPDLLADARLRQMQALGGAAEVQLLGDRDERPELAEFHSRDDRPCLSQARKSVLDRRRRDP